MRTTSLKRAVPAFALLGAVLHVAPAFAQQGPESEGERLFREGRAAMLEGRFDEACPKLAESQRLEPHVGTLLNLAACDERRGKWGSAWVEYQKALTAARAEGQRDREKLAQERIAVVEPRVPWLRVSAPGSNDADLVLALDGGELLRAAWGTEMPVDPGPHVVTATRAGKRVFEERIEIREREHRTVAVLPEIPAEGPPPPLPASGTEHVVVEPKTPSAEAPATKPLGHWILEPGLFVGWMGATIDHPRIQSGANEPTVVADSGSGIPTGGSCSSFSCDVSKLENGSFLVGLSFLAGYAISDSVSFGLRILGAPKVAKGGFFAFGPQITLRATSTLSIGVFGLFGDVSMSGKTTVLPPSGYRIDHGSSLPEVEGTLAGGPGIGLDVSLKIVDLQRGSLSLYLMPLFLGGNGSGVAVPLGIAYRFQ